MELPDMARHAPEVDRLPVFIKLTDGEVHQVGDELLESGGQLVLGLSGLGHPVLGDDSLAIPVVTSLSISHPHTHTHTQQDGLAIPIVPSLYLMFLYKRFPIRKEFVPEIENSRVR